MFAIRVDTNRKTPKPFAEKEKDEAKEEARIARLAVVAASDANA